MTQTHKGPSESSPHPKAANAAEPTADRLRIALQLFMALVAVSLLAGCASLTSRVDEDPWAYNPNTGYPLIGGPLSYQGR